MGFRPTRTPFKLNFSGTEYEGLEVSARPVPLSVMLDVGGAISSQDPQAFRHVAVTFAYALESWNVEDEDGSPVAADMDGLMSLDMGFALAVIKTWMETMNGTVQ